MTAVARGTILSAVGEARIGPAPGPARPGGRNRHALGLFAGLADDYDRWASILSLGQDPRWRRFLVGHVAVPPEASVLDVACGTGAISLALVRRHGCRVVAVDQSPEMLARADQRLRAAGVRDRVELLQLAAEELPRNGGRYDGLTCAYLLRYVDDPARVVAGLVGSLRPGAPFAYLDFAVPRGIARPAWEAYTRVGLPLAGRVIAPAWREVGRFLHGSIRAFDRAYPPEALAGLFTAAGCREVRRRSLSLGGAVAVWGRR